MSRSLNRIHHDLRERLDASPIIERWVYLDYSFRYRIHFTGGGFIDLARDAAAAFAKGLELGASRQKPSHEQEDQLWSDAYYIGVVGASNPKGVLRTLVKQAAAFGDEHPAVRVIFYHLLYLLGSTDYGDAGIESDLERVRLHADRLGLIKGAANG